MRDLGFFDDEEDELGEAAFLGELAPRASVLEGGRVGG